MASFSVSGLVPISAAIAGSDVEMTVESMFSMNKAVATMSGIRRSLFIRDSGRHREEREPGLYHPAARQAIADTRKPPKSCVMPPAKKQVRPAIGHGSKGRRKCGAEGFCENPVHGWQTL